MKKIVFLLAFMTLAISVMAQQISVNEAMNRAAALRPSTSGAKGTSQMGAQQLPTLCFTKEENGNNLYYVFNYPDGGFAIIGGDNVARTLLGYSETGTFSHDNIPDALKDMLSQYSKEISLAITMSKINGGIPVSGSMLSKAGGTSFSTLGFSKSEDRHIDFQTKWNQEYPYNSQLKSTRKNNLFFLTGCVATAGSQVMKFYEYPERGTGEHTDSVTVLMTTEKEDFDTTFVADYGSSYYDWSLIRNTYSDSDVLTVEEEKAIGSLLRDVGVSVDMQYGVKSRGGSGSSMKDLGYSLREYFGYDKSIDYRTHEYYTAEQWDSLLLKELDANRPVIYSGSSNVKGGHAFILHGYRSSDDTYEINWGWGGLYDGYYPITGVDPLNYQEIVGAGFCNSQAMLRNIMPEAEQESETNIVLHKPIIFDNGTQQGTLNRASGGKLNIQRLVILNEGYDDAEFLIAIECKNIETGKKDTLYSKTTHKVPYGKYTTSTESFTVEKKSDVMSDNGVYEVRPMYRAIIRKEIIPTDSVITDTLATDTITTDSIAKLSLTKLNLASDSLSTDSLTEWFYLPLPQSEALSTVVVNGGSDNPSKYVTFVIDQTTIQDGEKAYITHDRGYGGFILYESSNEEVAKVNSMGVVTGIAPGTATITVTCADHGQYYETSKTFDITVVKHTVNSVPMKISSRSIIVNQNTAISITAQDYTGTVTYSSSNDSIAVVTPEGKIYGIRPGVAYIKAAAEGTKIYHPTTRFFDVTVEDTVALSEGLCFYTEPKFNGNNIYIAGGKATMNIDLRNNSDEVIRQAYVWVAISIPNVGTARQYWGYSNYPANFGQTGTMDLSNAMQYTQYLQEGDEMKIQFFKDQYFSVPFNIPSVTVKYMKTQDITYTMGEGQYGTLMLASDTDIPAGLEAYECDGYTNKDALLLKVTTLKANTPYIITGKPGTYTFKALKQNGRDYLQGNGFLMGKLQGDVTLTANDYVPSTTRGVSSFACYKAEGLQLADYQAFIRTDSTYLAPYVMLPALDGESQTPILTGDADADGRVTLTDAKLATSHYLGNYVKIDLDAADTNDDGKVNITDANAITNTALSEEE